MVTIAHIVGKEIKRKPFLEEALIRGIINYGALADMIMPEIEKELGKKVKHSAVMMALRRYCDKAEKKGLNDIRFDENSDIIMRSDLIEITIFKTSGSGEMVKKLYQAVDQKRGDVLSIVQGLNEISIITNKKNEKSFFKILDKKEIKNVTKGLSSITINIPEESTETVGLFYMITRTLSWENISIIEIVSTWSEMTYILKTEDAPYAFKVIKNIIEENKDG